MTPLPPAAPPLVHVREAGPADLPAVAAYAAALARLHAGFDGRRFTYPPQPADATFAAFFAAQLDDSAGVLLVAEPAGGGAGGAPVGYAFGRLEPPSLEALAPASGWIHDLYVAPEGRHRGAGTALLDGGIAALRSRGAGMILLAVAPANAGAQRVFARRGFRVTMSELMLDAG